MRLQGFVFVGLEAQRRQIKAEQAQLDADLNRLRQRSN